MEALPVKSANRALDIFELLATESHGLTVSEIGDKLGLARSSAHGLVRTLHLRGYLMEDGVRRYHLGARLIQLGLNVADRLELRTAARGPLERLVAATHDTALLVVPEAGELLYVDKVLSDARDVRTDPRVASRRPLHCSSLGKALLAALDDESVLTIVEAVGLERVTEYSLADRDELLADLALTRRRGYAVDRQEALVGVWCVGAPIRDHTGRSIGGSGRTLRVSALPIAVAVVAAVLLAVFESDFYRSANLHVLMQQCSVLGIVTLGQLLVLLVGGIDLSVGAVMNATLIIIAVMNRHHTQLATSIVLSLCLGVAVGLVNGVLVSLRDVPPFAATLGMLACLQGAILVYTKGVPAGNIPRELRPVALDGIGIVPYSLIICLAIALVLWFALRRGTYGRKIYAVGRSPEVARRVAISTTNVRVSAYVMCGLFAAMAGIILSAYVGYVDPTIGGNYNLQSIAAAVVGGVAFTGGEGSVIGALTGVFFLLALLNVVTLSSLNPFMQLIIQGAVMLVAVSVFQFLKKKSPAN